MITKLSHASIYVLDQESAYDFYVNKLGFVEKMKVPIGNDAFWLTVCPKGQKEIEITLMPINKGGMFDEEVAKNLSELVKKGTFGCVKKCWDLANNKIQAVKIVKTWDKEVITNMLNEFKFLKNLPKHKNII